MNAAIRLPVEQAYAAELQALARNDDRQKPAGWSLSPKAVVTYLLGGKASDGTVISPKYVGRRRLIETAVATLATDRALLLLGVPGTAKSWVSEHLAAAIIGRFARCSSSAPPAPTRTRSATAGTTRSCWRRALAARRWCRRRCYRAMEDGRLCRLEELTRMGSDVQDTLITVLSEKMHADPGARTPRSTPRAAST